MEPRRKSREEVLEEIKREVAQEMKELLEKVHRAYNLDGKVRVIRD